MSKKINKAGQFEVGQRVEYHGKRFDYPSRTSERFTVQGEIVELRRGEDGNVVFIDILADGATLTAYARFHPLGSVRLGNDESIQVLHRAPLQREIAA